MYVYDVLWAVFYLDCSSICMYFNFALSVYACICMNLWVKYIHIHQAVYERILNSIFGCIFVCISNSIPCSISENLIVFIAVFLIVFLAVFRSYFLQYFWSYFWLYFHQKYMHIQPAFLSDSLPISTAHTHANVSVSSLRCPATAGHPNIGKASLLYPNHPPQHQRQRQSQAAAAAADRARNTGTLSSESPPIMASRSTSPSAPPAPLAATLSTGWRLR